MAYQRQILFEAEKRDPFLLFFGASTLAFAALAASYYGDSDYNPRIISILPQSDQALSGASTFQRSLFRSFNHPVLGLCDVSSGVGLVGRAHHSQSTALHTGHFTLKNRFGLQCVGCAHPITSSTIKIQYRYTTFWHFHEYRHFISDFCSARG